MNYKEIFDERGVQYNRAHQVAPDARKKESEAMLKWLAPQPGETIVVVAAGGGFDAVSIEKALFPDTARIICVEPSPVFSQFIPAHFEVHHAPLESIPLEDRTVDAVVNLAALHHVQEREKTLAEWLRILRPGGRLVVGDVMEKRGNARFLNDTVDRFTPGGHDGSFSREAIWISYSKIMH